MATTLRFTDADARALRTQAKIENRSVHDVARAAIREYLGRRGHTGLLDPEVRNVITRHTEVPGRTDDVEGASEPT